MFRRITTELSNWRRKPANEDVIKQVAEELAQNRRLRGEQSHPEKDLEIAHEITQSPWKTTWFATNRGLIKLEKKCIEPFSRWLKRSAIFDIFEHLGPSLEAVGVLLIPCVLFWASCTQENQREIQETERLQQDKVQDYLGRLTEIFLNIDGDIRDDKNKQITELIEASTLNLLKDPDLDEQSKGEIISTLSIMNLIQGEPVNDTGEDTSEDKNPPIISLEGMNFRNTDLRDLDLKQTILSNANFNQSFLRSADLKGSIIRGTDFRDADFRNANLRDTKHGVTYTDQDPRSSSVPFFIRYTDFSEAFLHEASFSGADLDNTIFENAWLHEVGFVQSRLWSVNFTGANLSNVVFSDALITGAIFYEADLSEAILVDTVLKESDFSNAILRYALLENLELGETRFEATVFEKAIILSVDLRKADGLEESQFIGITQPFICNSPLPESIVVDQDRDCEVLPSILQERYPYGFKTLEEAEAHINERRLKKWD